MLHKTKALNMHTLKKKKKKVFNWNNISAEFILSNLVGGKMYMHA